MKLKLLSSKKTPCFLHEQSYFFIPIHTFISILSYKASEEVVSSTNDMLQNIHSFLHEV